MKSDKVSDSKIKKFFAGKGFYMVASLCLVAVGVAALVLSYARNTKKILEPKTVDDYRQIFKKYTIPITNPDYANNKFYQGFGIIDPRKLLEILDWIF